MLASGMFQLSCCLPSHINGSWENFLAFLPLPTLHNNEGGSFFDVRGWLYLRAANNQARVLLCQLFAYTVVNSQTQ
jgi:hypothetical protein